ncbi:MAG: trigger factor [Thermomicrobiales bacterium]
MNVAVERLPDSQVVLDITTDEQEFNKALDRAYRKVVNQVRMPGFRPGKVPRHILEKMMGRDVLIEQADRDLLDPLYQQAVEQENLTPVGEPSVDIYQAEPLGFKITVEVYPTIDPGDYTSVRVEPRHVAISDEQVDEALDRLHKQHSPWEEPAEPRPAQEGDRVTLDVTVHEVGSDEPFREPLTDSVFVLGQDNLFPALHDAIVGMSVGDEKTAELSFGEDDEAADANMRGKSFNYGLNLKKIEEQHLLPLDDDFAGTASGGKQATLTALRDDLRNDLLRAERQQARSEIGADLVKQIGEATDFAIPAVMIDKQVDSQVEELRNHLSQDHGQTLETHLRLEDKTLEELRDELRPEAARRLRNSLVLREIATREGVSVTPQDIDAEIERLVAGMENPDQMRQIYSGSYIRGMLENELFERSLLDRVIAIATEGRGAYEPADEPAAAAEPAEDAAQTATAASTEEPAAAVTEEAPTASAATESEAAPAASADAGLPDDKSITIAEGEAVAESETPGPGAETA